MGSSTTWFCSWSNAANIRIGTTRQFTTNIWTGDASKLQHSLKTKCAKASSPNPSRIIYPPPSCNHKHHPTQIRITTRTHQRFGAKAEDSTPSLILLNYQRIFFLVLVQALEDKTYPTSCRGGNSVLDQHQLLSNPFDRLISLLQSVFRPPTFISLQHSVGILTTVNVLYECTYLFYSIMFFVTLTQSVGFLARGRGGGACSCTGPCPSQ